MAVEFSSMLLLAMWEHWQILKAKLDPLCWFLILACNFEHRHFRITLEIMESRTLFHWILLKIVVPLSSTVEFHPPQRKVCQESVAKNHRYQGTNFLQATVSCYPVYWRHDVLVLYFEKKLIGMIVERNMADPGYEHWNFLQNYRQWVNISALRWICQLVEIKLL